MDNVGRMHRTPGPRLAKLERWARESPCPVCGRVFSLRCAVADLPEMVRLNLTEQSELVAILTAASTDPCARCGRTGHALNLLNSDQQRRLVPLVDKLLERRQ